MLLAAFAADAFMHWQEMKDSRDLTEDCGRCKVLTEVRICTDSLDSPMSTESFLTATPVVSLRYFELVRLRADIQRDGILN